MKAVDHAMAAQTGQHCRSSGFSPHGNRRLARLAIVDAARLLGGWLLFGALVLAEAGALQAQPNETVSKIVAAWERRRTRLPLVRYELTGERRWYRGGFNDPTVPAAELPGGPGDNPAEDVTEKLTRTVLLDFGNNRHRIEWDHPEYSNIERRVYRIRCLNVYDGESLRSWIFENTGRPIRADQVRPHVDLLIQRGPMPVSVFTMDYLPLLLGHGIVSYHHVRPRPGALAPPLRAQDFFYAGERQLGGRTCAILRTSAGPSGAVEFWVDVPLDAAVLRIVERPEKPTWMLDVRYHETAAGWLVEGWTQSGINLLTDGASRTEDVLVTSIEPHPPVTDADFQVDAVPGMYVHEITHSKNPLTGDVRGQNEYYRIEADGVRTPLDPSLRPLAR